MNFVGATDSVGAVWFNFMTIEEVWKHSFENHQLPMPGGLYDPVLGPLEDRAPGCPPFTVEKTGKSHMILFKNRSNENKPKNDGQEGKDAKRNSKKEPDEEKILIYINDLVHGVIDKAQFADCGLVRRVQELYGSNTAGFLLSVFSRLFTVFVQIHGFKCGVDDLLIMKDKDIERKKQLEECEERL